MAGPLGQPTEIEKIGRVVCVGGGVGTAVVYPLAQGLAEAGNELTTIIGGRSEKYVILQRSWGRSRAICYTTTEDGTCGEKGFVTLPLKRILEDPGQRPAAVYAVGPVPMMRAVCESHPRLRASAPSSRSTRSWWTAPACAAAAG